MLGGNRLYLMFAGRIQPTLDFNAHRFQQRRVRQWWWQNGDNGIHCTCIKSSTAQLVKSFIPDGDVNCGLSRDVQEPQTLLPSLNVLFEWGSARKHRISKAEMPGCAGMVLLTLTVLHIDYQNLLVQLLANAQVWCLIWKALNMAILFYVIDSR